MATGFIFKTLKVQYKTHFHDQKRFQVSQKYRLTNNSLLDSDNDVHSTTALFKNPSDGKSN